MASLTHPDYCTVSTCNTRGCGSTITVDQYNECRVCDAQLCDECTYECAGCEAPLCIDHVTVSERGAVLEFHCRGCAVLGALAFALQGVA